MGKRIGLEMGKRKRRKKDQEGEAEAEVVFWKG
jgi:hypothetical protein